jgi:GcrA cell cycle regulator
MPPHPDDRWPEERTAKLRALVAQGYSARQIGAALGVTRSAALGKLHRMGLHLLTVRKPAAIKKPRKRIKMILPRPLHPPVVPVVPEVAPANGPIGIMELTAFTCRWPIGERAPYRFCGTTKPAGGPYCREHTAIAVGHSSARGNSWDGLRRSPDAPAKGL